MAVETTYERALKACRWLNEFSDYRVTNFKADRPRSKDYWHVRLRSGEAWMTDKELIDVAISEGWKE